MARSPDLNPPDPEGASTVSVYDVAREAGVSQSAVSRAFTPGSSLSAEKRARIMATAERLGYRPNPLARSLLHGRSNIVGVGVGDLENPFFVQTLQLLSDALNAANLRMMLFPAADEPSIHEVLHYRIDALVLLSVSLTSRFAAECRRAGVPIVLYNRTTDRADASCVVGDNRTGARIVAAHLIAGGHRQMAFMAGTPHASTSIAREEGFAAYLAEQGVAPALRESGDFSFEGAMAATRRLLARADRPDAIFCANDTMALGALTVARHEFGLDVGREISIVGYDDVPMAAWPCFSLTTYSQPASIMVSTTVNLIQALREKPGIHETLVCDGKLVLRNSSRPVDAVRTQPAAR